MSKVNLSRGSYWPYIIFAYLCLLGLGFMDNTRGAVFENFIQDLGLTDSRASLFFVVPSTFAFLSSMYCQRWMESLGPIFMLRLGLALMGASIFSFGLSSHFILILLEGVVFGIGFGIVSVAQNVAISSAGNPALRRQLYSGLHSMYGVASLLAPLIAGYLFALGYLWQGIFLFCSILPVIIFIGSFFYRFRSWQTIQHEVIEPTQILEDLTGSVKRHQLYLAASLSVYLIAEISVSSRMVVLIQRKLSLPPENATVYLVVFFLCLFLSRVSFALLKFQWLSTRTLIQLCLWGTVVLTSLGLAVNPWFLSLSGLTMGPFFPAALDYLSERFGTQAHVGIAYTMAFASLTVVAMHFLVGLISDSYGIETALWIAPVALIISSGLLFIERLKFPSMIQ